MENHPKKRRRLVAEPDVPSGWSDLPQDIIGTILKKLTLVADYDRFGSVCVSWRQASLETLNRNLRIESKITDGLPLLLLPCDRLLSDEDKLYHGRFKTDCNPWKRTLFDVFRRTTLTDDFNLPPIPNSLGRCCGSSHGWLIFADSCQNILLVNPFYIGSCREGLIRLPSVYDEDYDGWTSSYIPEFLVEKVILSADPALFPNDYAVVTSGNLMISFIRPGKDTDWTHIGARTRKQCFSVEDIMFRRNNSTIYAVDEKGAVHSCKITDQKPKLRRLATPPVLPSGRKQLYLVGLSQGEILVVCRLLVGKASFVSTTGFRAFKLLTLGGRLTAWHEVKNLGSNKALFLGENHSTCVEILTSHHLGFQKNSIYFTDDRNIYYGIEDPFCPCADMGIFNMKDQTIQRYYDQDQLLELVCIPPPIWFLPSLPGNWK